MRAEGERAKAEAEAREQRKRRRVQAALGVAVLAAVAMVAFGLWWEDRRTAKLARERADARATAHERLRASLDRAATAFRQDRPVEAAQPSTMPANSSTQPVRTTFGNDTTTSGPMRPRSPSWTGSGPGPIPSWTTGCRARAPSGRRLAPLR